ncbi:MAG TPA: 50S ribosomal protein L30 [archaeon]|nr:50S ribosomal protein L30 [archaeon]
MIAAIRVRGTSGVTRKLRETMYMLRLHKVNHLVLVADASKKMVDKVKDYVTFGEIDENTLIALLEKRAEVQGNKKITEEFLKSKKIPSVSELAKTIISGKKKLKDFEIEPVFRLRPPRKGYERQGIKKQFKVGGALGYRASKINDLIARMI